MYDHCAKHFSAPALTTPSCVRPLSTIYNCTHDVRFTVYIRGKKRKIKLLYICPTPATTISIRHPHRSWEVFGYLKLCKTNNYFNENNVSEFRTKYTRICIHNIACAKRVGFGRKAAYGRLRGPLILRRSHLIIYICPYGLCEYIYIYIYIQCGDRHQHITIIIIYI